MERRHTSGVFVVGAPRSGTTLLALILMDLPQFATYRAESKLLTVCRQRFNPLSSPRLRDAFRREWYGSMQFARSGLSHHEFEELLTKHGDWYELLMAFMEAVAEKQGKTHWCDSEPDNGYYIHDIVRRFPDARVIHIIRDGRAVAVSQEKLGWLSLPVQQWPRSYRLVVTALQWERSVNAMRIAAAAHRDRVFTVRYEELVLSPEGVLQQLGEFLELETSILWRGQRNPLSMVASNTAFGERTPGLSRSGIDRWRDNVDAGQEAALSWAIGDTLQKLQYDVDILRTDMRLRVFTGAARQAIALKQWGLAHTVLGRWSNAALPTDRPLNQGNTGSS